jgi:DNA-binding beta-propeller fold protein YncE
MDRRAFLAGAAGLVLAPQALARGVGGTWLALATADTEAHVAVVDVTTGRVVARIPTLAAPRSIEAVHGWTALVAHSEHAAVSLVDPHRRDVVAVLEEFDEPRCAAASHPVRPLAFVTDSGSGDLVSIDVVRARVLGRVRLGGAPRHLTLSPAGAFAWVALGNRAERLAVVDVSDPRRPRVTGRIRPPFLAHDVGFEPEGRRVWVTSGDRGSLAVYGARSGQVAGRLRGDAPPQHVAFQGGRAYVTSGDDGTLRVHDVRSGRGRRTARVPFGSYNVDRAGGLVVTPSLADGTVCIFRSDGSLYRRTRVAPSTHDACLVVTP